MAFERMVLRLHEVKCPLPPLIKAWLYVDKLRLSEQEELALMASVGKEYDVKRLQQAALIQDKAYRRSSAPGARLEHKPAWRSKWPKHTVHVTDDRGLEEDESEEDLAARGESDDELVEEAIAEEAHTAFMAFQAAKAKYREAVKGRGTDAEEMKRRGDERLKPLRPEAFAAPAKGGATGTVTRSARFVARRLRLRLARRRQPQCRQPTWKQHRSTHQALPAQPC